MIHDRFKRTSSFRKRHAMIRLIVCVMLACGVTASAHAQSVRRPQVSQGLNYISWKVSGDENFTLAQWFAPVVVHLPIRRTMRLTVFSGFTRSDADWSIPDDNFGGLIDSKVLLEGSFYEDQVLLSAGFSLPTGQTKLNSTERSLLAWLTSDFLNFPLKLPGEGTKVFGEVGFAVPAGPWVVGGSMATIIASAYTPYADADDYRPGARMIATVGADRRWDNNNALSTDIVFIKAGDDEADGVPIFRNGMRIDLRGQGQLVFGNLTVEGALRFIVRARDDRAQPGNAALIRETHNTNGSDMRLRISPSMPFGRSVTGWLSYDTRILAANQYAANDELFEGAARIYGFGGGADIRLNPHATAGIGVRIWRGSSDGSARFGPLDLSGFELIQRLTISL